MGPEKMLTMSVSTVVGFALIGSPTLNKYPLAEHEGIFTLALYIQLFVAHGVYFIY